jgi:hypothetical protein
VVVAGSKHGIELEKKAKSLTAEQERKGTSHKESNRREDVQVLDPVDKQIEESRIWRPIGVGVRDIQDRRDVASNTYVL